MTKQRNDNYFSFPGFHGLSATTLKLIAIVTMFIDHFAVVFEARLDAAFPFLVMDDGLVAVSSGFENDIGCLGPGIQYHKADVVARGSVFGTDVAESDHQVALVRHGLSGFSPPQQPQ